MARRRRWIAVGVVLAAWPHPVRSASEPAATGRAGIVTAWRWQAPPACPDADAVAASLEGLLGTRTPEAAGRIDGVISPAPAGDVSAPPGYVLDLTFEIDGRTESRQVRSGDCGLLAKTAALLVAIAVDAVATADALDLEGPGPMLAPPILESRPTAHIPALAPAQPRTLTVPRPAARRVRPDPAVGRRRVGLDTGVAGGLGVGLVPGPTGGVEAMFGVRLGALHLRIVASHWVRRSTFMTPDAGVVAALSGSGARGCYAIAASRAQVPLCLGVDVAALHGRGRGAAVRSNPVVDLWAAAVAGAGIEVPRRTRVAVQLRVEAALLVRRPGFHLDRADGPQLAFRGPPVGFRLVLGAIVRAR